MVVQNLGVPPLQTWGPKLPVFDFECVYRRHRDLSANIFGKKVAIDKRKKDERLRQWLMFTYCHGYCQHVQRGHRTPIIQPLTVDTYSELSQISFQNARPECGGLNYLS